MVKFSELKNILSYDKKVYIYDDDGTLRDKYSPASFVPQDGKQMDATYDECNVYRLDFNDEYDAFEAYIEIPTWTVTGTITIDVEFVVKALSEEDAFECADNISAETSSYGEMRVYSYNADIDNICLGGAEFDWDNAEEDNC